MISYIYVGLYAALLAAFFPALALNLRKQFLCFLAAICLIAAATSLVGELARGRIGCDYEVFWIAGRRILGRLNPYDPSSFSEMPFVSPPTFFPIAAALALPPLKVSNTIWAALNFLGGFCLVPLARRVLTSLGSPDGGFHDSLDTSISFVLSCIVALSFGSYAGLRAGQLSTLTSLAILTAILERNLRRPIAAGFSLAVATVKYATLIPFLLLFTGAMRRRIWASLIFGILTLSAMFTSPFNLAGRLDSNWRMITQHTQEGQINDYSYTNKASFNMIGFDRMSYCFGLRDRGLIRIVQLAVVGALGCVVAWEALWNRRLAPQACAAVVACYSMLFVYHRFYDTSILALPLVYCVAQLRNMTSGNRWVLILASAAIVGAMQGAGDLFYWFYIHTRDHRFLSLVVQVLILPLSTWLILSAFLLIWWNSRMTAAPISCDVVLPEKS